MSTARIILPVANNRAYGPTEPEGYHDELAQGATLGDLIRLLTEAAEEHGEDALVVTRDNGNYRGACFGFIYKDEERLLAVGQCEYCEESDCDGTCEEL